MFVITVFFKDHKNRFLFQGTPHDRPVFKQLNRMAGPMGLDLDQLLLVDAKERYLHN